MTKLREYDHTSDARKPPLPCFSLSFWRPSIGDRIRVPARRMLTVPLAVNEAGVGLNPPLLTLRTKMVME